MTVMCMHTCESSRNTVSDFESLTLTDFVSIWCRSRKIFSKNSRQPLKLLQTSHLVHLCIIMIIYIKTKNDAMYLSLSEYADTQKNSKNQIPSFTLFITLSYCAYLTPLLLCPVSELAHHCPLHLRL